MQFAWLFCVIMAVDSGASVSEIPEALLRAREARERLHTAHLELSLYEASELHPESSVVRFETWRAAGDQMLIMSNGDADGVTLRGADRERQPYNKSPRSLLRDGQVWHHLSNGNSVHVMDGARAASFWLHDWRKIGLNPVTLQVDFDQHTAQFGNPEIRYQASTDGDLELVRADVAGGAVFHWWIDPQRDWNVVKTRVTLADGSPGRETRFELAYNPHDGIWFPKRVEQFHPLKSEPTAVYEIIAARFNRPEHPAELTPADIGIGAGMTISYYEGDAVRSGIWDGREMVEFDEFYKRLISGETEVDPITARGQAMARAYGARAIERGGRPAEVFLKPPDHARSAREGAWRRYTREFIERYALDDEQTQKAWSICEECLERADAYIDSRRDEFAELEKTALDKPAAAPRDRAGPSGDDAAIERRRAELLRPIDEIFERALKPRLEVLPTRQQRAKAEANE